MDLFKNLLPGGSQQQQAAADSPSLLADWTSYQQQSDVEAGGSTAAAGSGIAAKAEEVGSSITSFFRSGYAAVSDGVTTIGNTSLETSIPTGQQMVHFFSFLGVGVLFLFFAFFIGLPTLLLSPSKFALFFTIGCCLVLSAFAALKGWCAQMQHMMARERLLFSAGYIGSVVMTLYAALIMKSYVLSLLCSGLQVVALLYYLTSYYPGGTSSVKFMLSMFGSAASSCFSTCSALVFGSK
uniref:Vesicle transport protein n=1 Tax=Tetradesmus obliquus TaxID=3088 RepID=A0A383VCL2_TETOB|eukprot:jgi/Sobl393_1/8583/SZX63305.1